MALKSNTSDLSQFVGCMGLSQTMDRCCIFVSSCEGSHRDWFAEGAQLGCCLTSYSSSSEWLLRHWHSLVSLFACAVNLATARTLSRAPPEEKNRFR